MNLLAMTTHDLYINNLGALILFGCKYVDRADAEDIVADLYFRIKDKTDLDRGYLFTSVYNACMNLIAKKKPIHDLPERAEEQAYVIEAEAYRRIDAAIDHLPKQQRLIIRMVMQDMTNSQIAAVLGVREHVVRNEKSRAVKRIKKYLK